MDNEIHNKLLSNESEKKRAENFHAFVEANRGKLIEYAKRIDKRFAYVSEDNVQNALIELWNDPKFDCRTVKYAYRKVRWVVLEHVRKELGKKYDRKFLSQDQSDQFDPNDPERQKPVLIKQHGLIFHDLPSNQADARDALAAEEIEEDRARNGDDLARKLREAKKAKEAKRVHNRNLVIASIENRSGFLTLLKTASRPEHRHLSGLLSDQLRTAIMGWEPPEVSDSLLKCLIDELNELINGKLLYVPSIHDPLVGVKLAKSIQSELAKPDRGLRIQRLNRQLIEETFPDEFRDSKGKRKILSRAGRAIKGRELLERICEEDREIAFFICNRLARSDWVEVSTKFLATQHLPDEKTKLTFGRACEDILDVGEFLQRAYQDDCLALRSVKPRTLSHWRTVLIEGFDRGRTKAGAFLNNKDEEWLAEFMQQVVIAEPPRLLCDLARAYETVAEETLLPIRTALIRLCYGKKMHDVSHDEEN